MVKTSTLLLGGTAALVVGAFALSGEESPISGDFFARPDFAGEIGNADSKKDAPLDLSGFLSPLAVTTTEEKIPNQPRVTTSKKSSKSPSETNRAAAQRSGATGGFSTSFGEVYTRNGSIVGGTDTAKKQSLSAEGARARVSSPRSNFSSVGGGTRYVPPPAPKKKSFFGRLFRRR